MQGVQLASTLIESSTYLFERGNIALVAQMRAGDKGSSSRGTSGAGSGRPTTSATVAVLADAATHGRTVWIGYVDARGTPSQRVVRPLRVGGGVLEGVTDDPDPDTDDGEGLVGEAGQSMTFALHRITSVSVLADR